MIDLWPFIILNAVDFIPKNKFIFFKIKDCKSQSKKWFFGSINAIARGVNFLNSSLNGQCEPIHRFCYINSCKLKVQGKVSQG